jgi:hypothetical protein
MSRQPLTEDMLRTALKALAERTKPEWADLVRDYIQLGGSAARHIAELEAENRELREKVSDWRAHLVAFTFAADPSEEGWKESAGDIANEMQAALEGKS